MVAVRATSNANSSSGASRNRCSARLPLSAGCAATLQRKTCSARLRASTNPAPTPVIFCTALFSGSGGTMTPRFSSARRSWSHAKSLKRRITSLDGRAYCGRVVRLRTL